MLAVLDQLTEYFEMGKTIPGTRSSHHFSPISMMKISHKLTSEENILATFNFSQDESKIMIVPNVSSYVSCVYDSIW